MAVHLSPLRHTVVDLKASILQQKNCKGKIQHETAEVGFIKKIDTIFPRKSAITDNLAKLWGKGVTLLQLLQP